MCGIAGLWEAASDPAADNANLNTAVLMADSLRHRDPDVSGVWSNGSGLVLAHRRLSIQDISAQGHQPMHSACGRYTFVYNGEIHNFQPLRDELQQAGCTFTSHSDTEVLLAGVVQWGLEAALQRFNGMFAFALWDSQSGTLFLARDRVGKKPLYFGWTNTGLVFASEPKTLRCRALFDARISSTAVALYLRHNCIPAPHSIYQGIFKLTPGSYLAITQADLAQRTDLQNKVKPFWDLLAVAQHCINHPFDGTFESASEKLESLLQSSVQRRMIADVPLGILLSRGIDSTLVTAKAQSGSPLPLDTFSTCLVAELAANSVTVTLTGDGGDELFYDYKRYFRGSRIWLHGPLRAWADSLLKPARLDREGIFNSHVVGDLWQNCKKNHGKGLSRIWTILMIQVWYEVNFKTKNS